MNTIDADGVVQLLGGLSSPAAKATFDANGTTVTARAINVRLSNAAIGDIIRQGSEHLISRLRTITIPPDDTEQIRVFANVVPPKIEKPAITYLQTNLEVVEIDSRQALVSVEYDAAIRVPLDAQGGVNEVSDTLAARVSENVTSASLAANLGAVYQEVDETSRMLVTNLLVSVGYIAVERRGSETFEQSQALPVVLAYCVTRGGGDGGDDSYGLSSVPLAAGGTRGTSLEGFSMGRTWGLLSVAKIGGGATDISEKVREKLLGHTLPSAWDTLYLTDGGPAATVANIETWRDSYRDVVRFQKVG